MTILPDPKLAQSTTDTALENDAIRMPFLRHAELVSASMSSAGAILAAVASVWTLKRVQGDGNGGDRGMIILPNDKLSVVFGECGR